LREGKLSNASKTYTSPPFKALFGVSYAINLSITCGRWGKQGES
jgi:hypothetical protein